MKQWLSQHTCKCVAQHSVLISILCLYLKFQNSKSFSLCGMCVRDDARKQCTQGVTWLWEPNEVSKYAVECLDARSRHASRITQHRNVQPCLCTSTTAMCSQIFETLGDVSYKHECDQKKSNETPIFWPCGVTLKYVCLSTEIVFAQCYFARYLPIPMLKRWVELNFFPASNLRAQCDFTINGKYPLLCFLVVCYPSGRQLWCLDFKNIHKQAQIYLHSIKRCTAHLLRTVWDLSP